jgi:hypothetical protein
MRAQLGMAVSLLVAGCDPGWTYHVATDRMPTVPTAPSPADSAHLSIELLEARLFAAELHIRVAMPNASKHGLTLDSASLGVLDRQGSPLARTLVGGCAIGYQKANLSTCSPWGDFAVNPTTRLWRPNPTLQELTVRVEATTRQGKHVTLTLPLTWDR